MKHILFSLLAIGALSLSSCNTMIGMGRDFRQVGEGLENKGQGRAWNNSPTTAPTEGYGTPTPPTY